jgi:hypothetical protein
MNSNVPASHPNSNGARRFGEFGSSRRGRLAAAVLLVIVVLVLIIAAVNLVAFSRHDEGPSRGSFQVEFRLSGTSSTSRGHFYNFTVDSVKTVPAPTLGDVSYWFADQTSSNLPIGLNWSLTVVWTGGTLTTTFNENLVVSGADVPFVANQSFSFFTGTQSLAGGSILLDAWWGDYVNQETLSLV